MFADWEVSFLQTTRVLVLGFVLICAASAPFSPILLILPIEESITYAFSMAVEAVPFQSRFMR